MPLSPQDILPAIPRQKVKNNTTGEIGGVIHYVEERKNFDDVLIVKLESGELGHWDIKRCELLPEEPRDFKVGDKVSYKHPSYGYPIYGKVTYIYGHGSRGAIGTTFGEKSGDDQKHLSFVTPEEISKYFN